MSAPRPQRHRLGRRLVQDLLTMFAARDRAIALLVAQRAARALGDDARGGQLERPITKPVRAFRLAALQVGHAIGAGHPVPLPRGVR